MENMVGYIVNIIFWLLGLVIVTLMLIRFIRQQNAKPITQKATVIDKQQYTNTKYAKAQAPQEEIIYTVTFLCNGKNLTFHTGAETYEACRIKQKGLLTYQGLQFVNFTTKQKEKV